MPVAINDKTGEVLALDGQGKWVPATRAKNPQTGEELYLDGSEWKTLNMPKPDPYKGMGLPDIQKKYQAAVVQLDGMLKERPNLVMLLVLNQSILWKFLTCSEP
jgi:hypothetical protein